MSCNEFHLRFRRIFRKFSKKISKLMIANINCKIAVAICVWPAFVTKIRSQVL